LELIDIAVQDKQPHPRLAGRTTGHVRAVLTEQLGGHTQNHELAIPVWADTAPGASEADIDMALMLKAAVIIARLKARLAG
jgi:hypothetical protein